MIDWVFKEDQKAWFGTDFHNPKFLFKIEKNTVKGFEPHHYFLSRLEEIDSENSELFYSTNNDHYDVFSTGLDLKYFDREWILLESSEQELVRNVQRTYKEEKQQWIVSFNKNKENPVSYDRLLEDFLITETNKLKEHAEFLINSKWNPFGG